MPATSWRGCAPCCTVPAGCPACGERRAPAVPAAFTPSFLLPRDPPRRRPRFILGLAVTTLQEQGAALLENGRIVAAVEEERLRRIRHYGWHPRGRPGVTLACDPTLAVEEAFCRMAAGALLAPRGLTLDDMDVIAVNGIPAKYRRAYSALFGTAEFQAIR